MMNDKEKIQIASESTRAVHKFIYSFTVSMFDSVELEISSGTLIEVGNRIFVATARHCVPTNPTGRLWILPERPRSMNEGMLGFVRSRRHPTMDLAFLELDPRSVAEYLPGHHCCKLENLSNRGHGRDNRIIAVCGSPVQFANGEGTATAPLRALNIAFSTVPFTRSEFPTLLPANRTANPDTDIFFEYPTEALHFETGAMIALTTPEGFSGGGIWDQGFDTAELWTPAHSKMIGIPSWWWPPQRYACGIQILHWLRLLWSEVEECRTFIEAAFPEESFTLLQTT
jgi:hypothetical protein